MLKVSIFLACVLGAVINAEGVSAYDNLPPGGPSVQGTVKPFANFSADDDAKKLRMALISASPDETTIIKILTHRSSSQRQEIKRKYYGLFERDILTTMRIKLTGYFYFLVKQLMMTPAQLDAYHMLRSMEGAGTDEDCIAEILSSRNNRAIREMKSAYEDDYQEILEDDLQAETSGSFQQLCVKLLKAKRSEGVPVNKENATKDAEILFYSIKSEQEIAESIIIDILATRSYEQLRLVSQEYKTLTGNTLKKSMEDEMSGDLTGLLPITIRISKGLGTSDEKLIRIVISRSEVDMVQIKQEFQKQFGATLESWLEHDLSGNYKDLIMALVTG